MLEFISTYSYLILIIEAFIIGYIIKEHKLFNPIWFFLSKVFYNKKLIMFLISNTLGSMPVPGRITISAPLLNTFMNNKNKLGVFNYFATHHYYFWSPLEKSVIIILGGLSINYSTFLYYIAPLLISYIVFMGVYIFFFVKEEDIDIDFGDINNLKIHSKIPFILFALSIISSIFVNPVIPFTILTIYYFIITKESIRKSFENVNWKLVLFVGILIAATSYIKGNVALPQVTDTTSIIFLLLIGFGFSLLFGSSSKYSGIAVALALVMGVEYLPIIFAVEFAGYFLSPAHKCIPITIGYFKTKISYFYTYAISYSFIIVGTGIVSTFLI